MLCECLADRAGDLDDRALLRKVVGDLRQERRVCLAPFARGHVLVYDGDPTFVRGADLEGEEVEPGVDRPGMFFATFAHAGPGHAAIRLEPGRLERGVQFADPATDHGLADQALSRRVRFEIQRIDRIASLVEDHLEQHVPFVD